MERYETPPGKQAQMDWGIVHYVDGEGKSHKTPAFIMIMGNSRAKYVEFTKRCDYYSLVRCMLNAFEYFGGVPETVLTDHMKTVVIRVESGKAIFHTRFSEFAADMGFVPKLCRVRRPQTKGKVENGVKYVKNNFYAGEEFSSVSEINEKRKDWLDKVNNRIHATTKEKPFDRLKKENLISICNKVPYDLSEIIYRKVQTDCRVCFRSNFYSVPFKYAGKEISLKISENNIQIYYRNEIIAEHTLSKDRNKDIIIEEHFSGLKELGLVSLNSFKNNIKKEDSYPEVEIRDLSFYQEIY